MYNVELSVNVLKLKLHYASNLYYTSEHTDVAVLKLILKTHCTCSETTPQNPLSMLWNYTLEPAIPVLKLHLITYSRWSETTPQNPLSMLWNYTSKHTDHNSKSATKTYFCWQLSETTHHCTQLRSPLLRTRQLPKLNFRTSTHRPFVYFSPETIESSK